MQITEHWDCLQCNNVPQASIIIKLQVIYDLYVCKFKPPFKFRKTEQKVYWNKLQ
jgi:hypothetical protein